jgi:hypothetical protein
MKIVILTSQSDTFWDLAKQTRKSKPRFNQSNPGSMGIHCNSLGIPLPSKLNTEVFSAWSGPIENVLAGPVIEVTRFGEHLTSKGHDVERWYLSSTNGWLQERMLYHPLWTNELSWQSDVLPDELVGIINLADILIVAVPSSIIMENWSLCSILSSHSKASLVSGGLAHDLVTLSTDSLALKTRGVARIGRDSREKIIHWLNK